MDGGLGLVVVVMAQAAKAARMGHSEDGSLGLGWSVACPG